MLSDTQGKVALVIVIVVVLGLVYFLWSKSASPTPVIPPGQTLQNPFGTDSSGPPGMRGGARRPR